METSSSFTSLASDSNSPQVSKKNLDNDSIEETPDETAANPWENDMNDKELQIIGKRTSPDYFDINSQTLETLPNFNFRTYRLGNPGEKRES